MHLTGANELDLRKRAAAAMEADPRFSKATRAFADRKQTYVSTLQMQLAMPELLTKILRPSDDPAKLVGHPTFPPGGVRGGGGAQRCPHTRCLLGR